VPRLKKWLTLSAVLVCLSVVAQPARAADHRLGLGLHYWKSLDELAKDFPGVSDSGVSWMASYQFRPAGLFKLEADLEYFRKGFGGSEGAAFSPQFFVLAGGKFYGGVGVGTTFASSFDNNSSSMFFMARAGLEITLVPGVHFDFNLNYKSDVFSELDNFNSNALTLGVFVRFNILSGGSD
jgi:hypothetical protein